MKNIRQQAAAMGHPVAGPLTRVCDDVYERDGEEIRTRQYTDTDGTVYAVDWRGELVYIAGED